MHMVHTQKEIHSKELTLVIMKVEKFHEQQLESRRPRRMIICIQSKNFVFSKPKVNSYLNSSSKAGKD